MKSTRSKITLSEHEIQNQIIEYLKIKKWFVMRLNSGTLSKEYNGKKYFVRGQDAGTPDLMCFKKWGHPDKHSVHVVFIEVKTPKNKPTALQTAKMGELEGYGAKCLIATCIEDVEAL